MKAQNMPMKEVEVQIRKPVMGGKNGSGGMGNMKH